MTQSTVLKRTLLFVLVIFCAGCGVHYRRVPANAVHQTSYSQSLKSADSEKDLKETFSMYGFGLSLLVSDLHDTPGDLQLRIEYFQDPTASLTAGYFNIAYSYPILTIYRFPLSIGGEFGVGGMFQELIEPYMDSDEAISNSWYGRGFIEIERRFFYRGPDLLSLSVAVEAGWSKYGVFSEWTVSKENRWITVHDKRLRYPRAEIGGYEFAVFLRFR